MDILKRWRGHEQHRESGDGKLARRGREDSPLALFRGEVERMFDRVGKDYQGCFLRTVTLPAYVDAAGVGARYEKGTLIVTVPKVPGQGPKRVQVKGG